MVGVLSAALIGCGKQKDRAAPPPFSKAPERRPAVRSQAFVPQPEPSFEVASLPQDSRLPLYELKMAAQDLMGLQQNAFSNDPRPATFVADGEIYNSIKVRTRGAWSRSWPKKSFKVTFNKDKLFEDHRSLDLNSGWHDPALIRETLAYQVYAACGALASTSRLVRLQVNGQFRGLYVEVEHPEKALLQRFNLKGATLFKATSRYNQADERDLGSVQAYTGHYSRESQKTNGLAEVQQFCHELQAAGNTLDFFGRNVDLEKYINFLAATVLTQNWDGFNKNHYLVYDGRGSRKWFVMPWDLDRTFGDHWNWSFSTAELPILLGTRLRPGVTGWNRLEDRFFSEPALRVRFLDRLQQLLDREFTTAKMLAAVDRLETQISPEAEMDRRIWRSQSGGDFRSGIAQVRSFIERRRAYLLGEIPRLRQNG